MSNQLKGNLRVGMIVNEYQMYLVVEVNGERIDIPYKEAEKLKRTIDSLVPYRHGVPAYRFAEFEGELSEINV